MQRQLTLQAKVCPGCPLDEHDEPIWSRLLLVGRNNQLLCCNCGTIFSWRGALRRLIPASELKLSKEVLFSSPPSVLPSEVTHVVQKLLQQHPDLWCDGKVYVEESADARRGALYTVQLFVPSPVIKSNQWFINLQWQLRSDSKAIDVVPTSKPYARELVYRVPDLIHALAETFVGCWDTAETTTILTHVHFDRYLPFCRLEQKARVTTKSKSCKPRLCMRAQLTW